MNAIIERGTSPDRVRWRDLVAHEHVLHRDNGIEVHQAS
jgi:hypothetical protein